MSQLNKDVMIQLENTAQYQPRSDLNVSFSTADRDSAIFIFNVTKGKKPYLLGPENVTGHIALKHSDKSFIKDMLTFNDPLLNQKGQFKYQIPNELLKRQGSVSMQVFVSEKGLSNVVVAERIMTFSIEKSIVGEISGETKLQYIIELDELYDRIEDRMTLFEQQMASGQDIITRINEAKEKGISDIEIAKDETLGAIRHLGDEKLQAMTDKGNEYSKKFDAYKTYIDERSQAFKASVRESGVITEGASEHWQKYALTNHDGEYANVNLNNNLSTLQALSPGFYYGLETPITISDVSNSGFIEVSVESSEAVKHIIYRPYNINRQFIMMYYNTWSEWQEIGIHNGVVESLQGEIEEGESQARDYIDRSISNLKDLLFEGSVKNAGQKIKLAKDYDQYSYLKITAHGPGGHFVVNADTAIKDNIIVDQTNINDGDGSGGAFYEAQLSYTDKRTLTITNDVAKTIETHQTYGAQANRITIKRIVGER